MRFSYSEEGPAADLTIDAWGATLGEAFASTALAMFNAMTPLEAVEEQETMTFKVEGDDLGALLFNFLDELLYIHEVQLVVFSRFDVRLNEEGMWLTAECRGERFDLKRHRQGIAVKAVTFHKMRIEMEDGCWAIRVVLDT